MSHVYSMSENQNKNIIIDPNECSSIELKLRTQDTRTNIRDDQNCRASSCSIENVCHHGNNRHQTDEVSVLGDVKGSVKSSSDTQNIVLRNNNNVADTQGTQITLQFSYSQTSLFPFYRKLSLVPIYIYEKGRNRIQRFFSSPQKIG